MRSPAEQTLEKVAFTKIDSDIHRAELSRRKRNLIGNIDRANQVIHRDGNVGITEYPGADGESVAVSMDNQNSSKGGAHTKIFTIKGRLSSSGQVAIFPMYKVVREEVASDTMSLPIRYGIYASDPESESGFTPLALVAGRTSDFNYDNRFMGDALTADQLGHLESNGFYENPHGKAMLSEVHELLGIAIDTTQTEKATNVA